MHILLMSSALLSTLSSTLLSALLIFRVFEVIINWARIISILETEFFQVNINIIIYTSNSLSKLWKRTLIQNENEMRRRWRLRETEKAINKTMIIIHSCLHFIISTTQFNQKTSNFYASFIHDWCYHLH